MKKVSSFLLLVFFIFAVNMTAKKKPSCPRVLIETTMGNMTVELFNETPIHRDNFLKLVKEHYYDSLLFHRVIADFMIQGGDPYSRHAPAGKRLGEGDPPYTLPAEIRTPDLYHVRGALCAARQGDYTNPERRSSGSQFYIVYGKTFRSDELSAISNRLEQMTDGQVTLTYEMRQDYQTRGGAPHLDGQYTVFGQVVEGLKVLKAIQAVNTDRNDRPLTDVRILKMTIVKD